MHTCLILLHRWLREKRQVPDQSEVNSTLVLSQLSAPKDAIEPIIGVLRLLHLIRSRTVAPFFNAFGTSHARVLSSPFPLSSFSGQKKITSTASRGTAACTSTLNPTPTSNIPRLLRLRRKLSRLHLEQRSKEDGMENDEKGGRRQGVDLTTTAQQHPMPTSSKLKFNRDDTLADTMAPPLKGRLLFPNPETQHVYNNLRRLQDEEFGLQQSLGRLPSRPLSPSRVPTMPLPQPPPPAIQSVVFRDPPQPAARLPFGRSGPLLESDKLRASLTRQLGACSYCHQRRFRVRRRPGLLSCGFGRC